MCSAAAPLAAPVAGAALPPAHALARAQAAKFDADRAFWEVRDHYWGPGRRAIKQAARQHRAAARAACATAAAAYHASPHAAALRAAGSLILTR